MPDTNPSDPNSSHLSPTPTPTWAPPRSPLPPHRLAKLANALGVSTPIPLTHTYSHPPLTPPSQPNSSTSSSFPDQPFRRSPTPSAASGATHVPSHFTSKYLLHVVPPHHLPHQYPDNDDLPPPPNTSGYHTQFKRGIMVPVYPTLQSQLGAIAKEYALPSTVGMILYIITTTPSEDEGSGEPGPRISDDVWRHIWTRVLKSERDEHPATRPKSFGLGLGLSTGSSPALLQDLTANGHAFRPLVPPRRVETPQPPSSASYPLTPSPSTPSHSAYSSQSEIDTPESASSVDPSSNTLPLPGLNSTSLVPILAKVEFDIDRRKAGWYDPWVRNRKASHAKRAESRLGTRSASRMDSLSSGKASAPEDGVVEGATKKFPFDLELVERLEQSKTPNFLLTTHIAGSISDIESLIDDGDIHRTDELDTDAGYQRLSESPIGGHPLGSEVDPEDDEGEDGAITARPSSNTVADPLADVFGTDEETWQDMHSESSSRRTSKPRVSANIVDLALDAAAISALPESLEEDDEQPDKLSDEQEVSEILHILSRPALAVSIPSSPPSANRRRSSPTTAGTIRKHIPPPLNLVVPSSNNPGLVVQALPSPMPESAGLAYLGDKTPSDVGEFIARSQEAEEPDEPEQQVETQKTQEVAEDPIAVDSNTSPQEEKRGGTIFGELDLGLDPSLETEESGEFDDLDPYDRRRSQYIMAAQLDEIEKNLAQFSPRRLNSEILADDIPFLPLSQSPSRAIVTPRSLGDFPDLASPTKSSAPTETPSWPAVPYSSLNQDSPRMGFLQSGNDSLPPSPPKFAFNGISTEPPKSPFQQTRARSGTLSDESMARKRALEEENALYPPLVPPSLFTTKQSDSPIIPLSPDPFGRFPTPAEYEEQRQSLVFAEDFPAPPTSYFHPASQAPPFVPTHQDRPPSHTPSSRFSADSVTSQDTPQQHLNVKPRGSSTLISVKSLRKLWRKSGNKGSVSGNSTPTIPDSGRTSPNASLAPPTNPQQAPLHQTPRGRNKSISKQLPPAPHESQSMNTLSAPTREPGMHELSMRPHHFEGEARYPRHPSLRPPQAPSSRSPNMPSPPLPHAPSPSGPTRTPSPNHQQQHSVSLVHQRQPSSSQHPPEKGLSVRKSILKSWKSATGLSSHNRSGSRPSSSSGPTPRSSTEQLPETGRRRRPSVLELATHAVRGSTASMATTLGDIPASPALPEQYQYQAHSRAASRQSEMNGTNGSYLDRQESVKGLFNLSSTSSPPRVRSPLHNSGSPPRSNLTTAAGSRTSQESFDSRPSFDVSQFEMISPPKTDSYVLESTLSYPYHGLDRSLVAHE